MILPISTPCNYFKKTNATKFGSKTKKAENVKMIWNASTKGMTERTMLSNNSLINHYCHFNMGPKVLYSVEVKACSFRRWWNIIDLDASE